MTFTIGKNIYKNLVIKVFTLIMVFIFSFVVISSLIQKPKETKADAIVIPSLVVGGILSIMGALGISNILDSNMSGSDISDFIINDMGLSNYTDSQGRTLGSFGVDAVAFESGRILLSNAFANFGKEFTEEYIQSNNITVDNSSNSVVGHFLDVYSGVYRVTLDGVNTVNPSSYSQFFYSDLPIVNSYNDVVSSGFLFSVSPSNPIYNLYFYKYGSSNYFVGAFDSTSSIYSSGVIGNPSEGLGNYFILYPTSNYLYYLAYDSNDNYIYTYYASSSVLNGFTVPQSSVLVSSLDPTYEDYQQAFDDAVRPDTEENEDEKTVAIPWAGDDLNTIDDFIDQILAGDITIDLAEEIAEPATTYSQETESTTLIDGQAPFNNYMPGGSFFDNLQSVFPFCLPFDFVTAINLLNADPVAPEFDFVLAGGGYFEDLETTISLEDFESVAGVFRTLMLILFIIGLIFATRKLIMWWPSG